MSPVLFFRPVYQGKADRGIVLQTTEDLRPLAPAEFFARQSGFGIVPDFDLYNLTADVPGHPVGSSVSAQTLTRLGYRLPATPAA